MSFLAPLSAAFFALAIPIIILYMLRLRRREVVISSTYLWEQLLKDREANTPWQKLRRNLLLILQLLILAMLTTALMRPALPAQGGASRGAAVIIDASASMNAADLAEGQTRFAAALDHARGLIVSLPPDEVMTLILAGPLPEVLAPATGDHAALRAALGRAAPSVTTADWISAFTLAAASLAGDPEAEIIVISDGGLPADLPVMPVPVRFIPVGVSGENLAISALAVRPLEGAPQLFASVTNTGVETREAILQITVDGIIHQAERISVAGGASEGVTITDLPESAAEIEATLLPSDGAPLDPLPLDDRAYAVYAPPASGDILLVSEGNFFLEQLLALLPGMTVTRAVPGNLPTAGADLVILDGWLPEPLPAGDLLIIDPPASSDAFTVGDAFTPGEVTAQIDDPILAFVDFSAVAIREANMVEAEGWARPLVITAGGSLMLVGEREGQKIAILPFDLLDSDLPLRIDFPILIANLLDWYAPAALIDTPEELRPGDPAAIRLTLLITQVRVTQPNGEIIRLPAGGEASIAFTETDQIGIYQVELLEGVNSVATASFAINSFAAAESDIQPREAIVIGEMDVAPASGGDDGGWIELWPVFAALALALLALEWWVYHRR